jgi:hypothetical protein
MEKYFHIISIFNALVSFTIIYVFVRPYLIAGGHKQHLTVLLCVHLFRYLGLIALLPGLFDLSSLGFTKSYFAQIAYGDFLSGLLAIVCLIAVHSDFRMTTPLLWFFNLFGFIDLLNAGIRIAPKIQDPNILGGLGWIIFTVYLPAVIVSHLVIFYLLLRRSESEGKAL